MSCRDVALLLEPFRDGELGPEKVLEVEQHVGECSLCAERVRLGQAMRASVRRTVKASSEPSAAFRQRLALALEATKERAWEARAIERQVEHRGMLPWRMILPLAAAAALVLVWARTTGTNKSPYIATTRPTHTEASIEARADQILEDLIDHHLRARPEVTEPNLLPGLEREVGVPVTIPSFARYGGRWEGGSVVPFRNERAASLRYKLSGHRLTLYVYDARRIPIEKRLQQRLVGDAAVYVGSRRGYSIGAVDRGRVGYAVASDFNDAETAELVAAIY